MPNAYFSPIDLERHYSAIASARLAKQAIITVSEPTPKKSLNRMLRARETVFVSATIPPRLRPRNWQEVAR
jgi:hypothetical protein